MSISQQRPHNLAILVVSCDAYHDLWQPFFNCFFKYWIDCPFPVYLGANFKSYYDDKRVQTILVGQDLDYSTNLLTMLEHIDHEWLILWIEDRVLSAPVNTVRLNNLLNSAISDRVGFLKLISSHPYAFVNDSKEIGEIPKGSKYRACMTVGLWNKNTLIQLIKPGESAWDFERSGSRRSINLKEKFCSLSYAIRNNPPLADTHLIIKGRLIRAAQGFLMKENLLHLVGKRPLQTLRSCLYVKLYLVVIGTTAVLCGFCRNQLAKLKKFVRIGEFIRD
jgi:hypothetical protein